MPITNKIELPLSYATIKVMWLWSLPRHCVTLCSLLLWWCEVMWCCREALFLRICEEASASPQIENWWWLEADTTKVQLGEVVSFIQITCRDMGERLLIGKEMTQRKLHYQNPPQHEWQLIEAGNLEYIVYLRVSHEG